MKKILLHIVVVLLFWPAVVRAVSPEKRGVKVDNLEIIQANDVAVIRFDLQIGKRMTKSNEALILTPVVYSGTNEWPLLPVVVEGRRGRVTETSRNEMDADRMGQQPIYAKNGETIAYQYIFDFREWMKGAELRLDAIGRDYYIAHELRLGTIATDLFPEPVEPIEIVEIQPPPVVEAVNEIAPATLSTGDEVAQGFSFVAPVSEFEKARQTPTGGLFDYNMALDLGKGLTERDQEAVVRFVNGAREGALAVRFRQGSRVIRREFEDNNRVLVDLISVIRALEESKDSRVARIVIAGFASPEGKLEDNEKLAWDRAEAVRDFIRANSTVDAGIVHAYNGSVDWEGLYDLVAASDMPEKTRILEIIDTMPVWDAERDVGRHGELMRLSGGEPYKYMLEHFFPQLRQAAYIKVYYENL